MILILSGHTWQTLNEEKRGHIEHMHRSRCLNHWLNFRMISNNKIMNIFFIIIK